MKKQTLNAYLFVFTLAASFLISGCSDELVAPQGSTILVLPEEVALTAGIPGDRTFVTMIAEVQNEDGIPLQEIDVVVNSAFLRLIDEDGNYIDSPATLVTDTTGRIRVSAEVTLGIDLATDIFFQSSAASTKTGISVASSSE